MGFYLHVDYIMALTPCYFLVFKDIVRFQVKCLFELMLKLKCLSCSTMHFLCDYHIGIMGGMWLLVFYIHVFTVHG